MSESLIDPLQLARRYGFQGETLDGFHLANGMFAPWDAIKKMAYDRAMLSDENEVLYAEREHARQSLDNAVRLLSGIYALLYPPRTTDSHGVTFVFNSPFVHEQMQELSDRIRALPDEVAAIRKQNDHQT